MRAFAGIVVGLLCGGLIFLVSHQVSQLIYPPPHDFDPYNREKVAALIRNMPLGGYLALILGYCVGSAAGGAAAAGISRSSRYLAALIVGVGLTILGAVNFFVVLPFHPLWVTVSSLSCYIPMSLFGAVFISAAQASAIEAPQQDEIDT